MEIIPSKIYDDYLNNNLDKNSAIEILISLIEDSDIADIRIDSIHYLIKIDGKNERIFKLLENLMISDSNEEVRNASAKEISNKFLNKALDPMKWAIQYESNYDCLITVIKTLESINNNESKTVLLNEMKRIRKKKYIDNAKQYNNKRFRKELKQLIKNKVIKNYSCKQLADIIINFRTIEALIKKFYRVYYELENALVIGLDLSEMGWNVNIWKQPYAERIQDISEITGLLNLDLKKLDLSNNRIKNVKGLITLKNLTYLKISNNRIEDIKNLDYFKNMSSLEFLDIKRNKIIEKIDIREFDKKLKILYKKGLTFI